MTCETVGILGGTFDPVHLGHLVAAEEVRRVFGLERVLLVPCADPPHKDAAEVTPARERVAMLRIAIRDRAGLEVSTVELERGGTSYTIDTLRSLRRGGRSPLFILGMDSLVELPTWHLYERLVEEFDLVAVDRPGNSLELARRVLGEIGSRLVSVGATDGAGQRVPGAPPGTGGRIFHLTIPSVAASSREIRARAALGAALAGLVPDDVARYIQAQNLYEQEETR